MCLCGHRWARLGVNRLIRWFCCMNFAQNLHARERRWGRAHCDGPEWRLLPTKQMNYNELSAERWHSSRIWTNIYHQQPCRLITKKSFPGKERRTFLHHLFETRACCRPAKMMHSRKPFRAIITQVETKISKHKLVKRATETQQAR